MYVESAQQIVEKSLQYNEIYAKIQGDIKPYGRREE